VIEGVLAEELADALDAGPYARTEGRAGYRNGKEKRTLDTSWGGVLVPVEIEEAYPPGA
jgi:transposase-like protein